MWPHAHSVNLELVIADETHRDLVLRRHLKVRVLVECEAVLVPCNIDQLKELGIRCGIVRHGRELDLEIVCHIILLDKKTTPIGILGNLPVELIKLDSNQPDSLRLHRDDLVRPGRSQARLKVIDHHPVVGQEVERVWPVRHRRVHFKGALLDV